VFVEVI